MVAAERLFQYLQLGTGSGGSGGSGSGPDCSSVGSAGGSQPAGTDVEQQALLLPLLPPLASAPRFEAVAVEGIASISSAAGWLQQGHVRFENVWMRYTPWQAAANGEAAPWVLRGVTLDVPPGMWRCCSSWI